ncbi:4-alpha-glucanotransferase [Klebsiella pneumoniae subsp. pneumoniae]|nr:4-alpha-glucanotransferase [Klebsiella pneumoniae subsp. pneumoniae]
MQNCGALRIDHVMSVLRLWWIPYGETADHGAYVQYPVDDPLSLLALESQRHRCTVIGGEDLGTVPVEIVSGYVTAASILIRCSILRVMQRKTFPRAGAVIEQSMAVATTHDLPTLRGYWESGDLTLVKRLGLYPDEVVLRGLYQDRELAKQGLLDALRISTAVCSSAPAIRPR